MTKDEWITELRSFTSSDASARLGLTPGEAGELADLLEGDKTDAGTDE